MLGSDVGPGEGEGELVRVSAAPPLCHQVPASYVSSTEVTCRTPVVTRASEECNGGEAVELALTPEAMTRNRAGLQRVATPSVLEVEPNQGYWRQPQWVRITGYGFLASKQLRCKFFAEGAGREWGLV